MSGTQGTRPNWMFKLTLSGNVFWVLVLLVPSTGSAASAALAG